MDILCYLFNNKPVLKFYFCIYLIMVGTRKISFLSVLQFSFEQNLVLYSFLFKLFFKAGISVKNVMYIFHKDTWSGITSILIHFTHLHCPYHSTCLLYWGNEELVSEIYLSCHIEIEWKTVEQWTYKIMCLLMFFLKIFNMYVEVKPAN